MKASVIRAPLVRESRQPSDRNGQTPDRRQCTAPEATPAEKWNRAVHANVAAMTFGLSPVSLALALLDWGAHLAVSPGKCFELATQAWLAAAPAVDGSWWTCWRDWLHARSSGDVPARAPAAGLAAAPGAYVLQT